MKTFDEYHVAEITEDTREKITNLEKEIKEKTGNEVVLIAYHEKHS